MSLAQTKKCLTTSFTPVDKFIGATMTGPAKVEGTRTQETLRGLTLKGCVGKENGVVEFGQIEDPR